MDDDSLKTDLLADWRAEKPEPPLSLELDDSRGAFWSLPYHNLQALKLSNGVLWIFFHRYRVRVRGTALRAMYDDLAMHVRAYIAPSPENAQFEDGQEYVSELHVEAVDEWADEPTPQET